MELIREYKNLEILDAIWVGQDNLFGFVKCKDKITNEIKFYGGFPTLGFDTSEETEDGDIMRIIEWGTKYDSETIGSLIRFFEVKDV